MSLLSDGRGQHGGRARERAPLRRDAAAHARVRGAPEVGRDLSSSLDLADRHGPHRAPREGPPAGGATARSSCPRRERRPIAPSSRWATRRKPSVRPRSRAARASSAAFSSAARPSTSTTPRPIRAACRFRGPSRRSDERLMVVPLGAEGAIEGAMAVWRTGGDPFDERELEFLAGLSRQATIALHNARLFNETQRRPRTPDGYGRHPACHQCVTDRHAACVRCNRDHCGEPARLRFRLVRSAWTAIHMCRARTRRREGSANALYTRAVFSLDASSNFPSQAIVWKRSRPHSGLGRDRTAGAASHGSPAAGRPLVARRAAAARRRSDRGLDASFATSPEGSMANRDCAGRILPPTRR